MSPLPRLLVILAFSMALAPGLACKSAPVVTAPPAIEAPTELVVDGYTRIPAGTFPMGSWDDEEEVQGTTRFDEHRVAVTLSRDFFIKTTEVTQGEWEAVMGSNPSTFQSCGADCPVEGISWFQSLAYLNALSKSEGLQECYDLSGCNEKFGEWDFNCPGPMTFELSCTGYRLPTEAEWEYAARAGSTTTIYTGDLTLDELDRNGPELDAIAWYGGNSGVSYVGGDGSCSRWEGKQFPAENCGTHPVGLKAPNSWGLYDMLGNVTEWTWDWKGAYPLGTATDPLGAEPAMYRVRRGCSWSSYASSCRLAARGGGELLERQDNVGLRPVRTAP